MRRMMMPSAPELSFFLHLLLLLVMQMLVVLLLDIPSPCECWMFEVVTVALARWKPKMMMMQVINLWDGCLWFWMLLSVISCSCLLSVKSVNFQTPCMNASSRWRFTFFCTCYGCFWPFGWMMCISLSSWYWNSILGIAWKKDKKLNMRPCYMISL
jgi:hypothetical protein